MNYLPNESHIRRSLKDYMGPWSGEIQQLLGAYTVLAERHRELKAVCDDMAECEGDITSVHVPHDKFRRFRAALSK